jgi:DNA replication and repair protein RecF
MHVAHLSLTNFRNYGRLEFDLTPGTTLLYGLNAQGKTNLLEALYYLATTRSPHADQDNQLINWDAQESDDLVVVGRLVAQIRQQDGLHLIELRLIQERNGRSPNGSFRREALVDKRKVRLMDLLGNLRVVLFLPEDIQLITGAPGERRRYMDITLCQIDPIYCRNLSKYNKLLEQRNALLRQIAEGQRTRDLLSIYSDRLVEYSAHIFTRRAMFLMELARDTQHIHYESLTGKQETIRLNYLPRLSVNQREQEYPTTHGFWLQEQINHLPIIQERLAQEFHQTEAEDIARGATRVGPHRDDWQFELNGRSLSSYGSRGQQRSAVLALKMAEITWMTRKTGEAPILLLDEVVAELDEQRRAALLQYIQSVNQTILTATDPSMFTPTFLQHTRTVHILNGRIQANPPSSSNNLPTNHKAANREKP